MKNAILGLLLILISACSSQKFFDGIAGVIELKTHYCASIPADVREKALERMQSKYDDYPDHSVCDEQGFILDILEPADES